MPANLHKLFSRFKARHVSPNGEEVANSSKKLPNSRVECTNHPLFQTMMVEIDTLFQTKTAKNHTIPFSAAHTYVAYMRNYPPPPSPTGRKTRCRL